MNARELNQVEAETLVDVRVKRSENKVCYVKKSLIPLKAALFLWFGGTSCIYSFMIIYLKQIGLTVSQISTIYMAVPLTQFSFAVISGIIADKIGRPKPVLVANMLLLMVALNLMLLIPKIQVNDCREKEIQLQCDTKLMTSDSSDICNSSKRHLITNKYLSVCTLRALNAPESDCAEYIHGPCKFESNKSASLEIILNSAKTNFTIQGCKAAIKIFSSCDNVGIKNYTFACACNYTKNNTEMNGEFNSDNKDYNLLVFVISMLLVNLYESIMSTCFRILDVTTMFMINAHHTDYGKERFWSISGNLVFASLSGYLIGTTTENNGPRNITTGIYLFDGLLVMDIIAVMTLDVQVKKPGTAMWKKCTSLLRNVEIMAFFVISLTLGTCWFFSMYFSPLFLDELGASSLLLGLDQAVRSVYGLPFLLTYRFWVKKIGKFKLFLLGFVGYVAMFVGYFLMFNPWWSLLNQFTSILTYHLLWVTVVEYSHDLAPEGLTATVMATAGALHFGVGKATASLIGGLTTNYFGYRAAYKLMAIIAFTAGLLYSLFLLARKRLKMCSRKI